MKRLTELIKKMDKTGWLVLGLCGILLFVIALPVDRIADKKEEDAFSEYLAQQTGGDEVESYEKRIVKQLEEILGCMDGVGKVRVMVTFADYGEDVVEKDISRSESTSPGILEEGTGTNKQYQETTIYNDNAGGQPFVSRKELPEIEGVLVIAQGGENSKVKQNILEAVMALFPLEAHKIKIVKMQNES